MVIDMIFCISNIVVFTYWQIISPFNMNKEMKRIMHKHLIRNMLFIFVPNELNNDGFMIYFEERSAGNRRLALICKTILSMSLCLISHVLIGSNFSILKHDLATDVDIK